MNIDEYQNKLFHHKQELNMYKIKLVRCPPSDKPTQFFLNQDKPYCVYRTLARLVSDTGKIIDKQKAILEEQVRYYKKLYTSSLSNLDEEKANRENIMSELCDMPSPKVNIDKKNPGNRYYIWSRNMENYN